MNIKKIPNISDVVKKPDYNTKIIEIENKITTDHDHDKYITTLDSSKLISENFTAWLAQAKLASKNYFTNFLEKTDFDDELKKLNKNVISNINELNELSKKN